MFPSFREDLDQEEKARFGELCSSENGKGREWFARYVSAQVRGSGGRQQGGILHGLCNSLRPGGVYLYPKEVFLEGRNSRKVQNHSRGRYRSE